MAKDIQKNATSVAPESNGTKGSNGANEPKTTNGRVKADGSNGNHQIDQIKTESKEIPGLSKPKNQRSGIFLYFIGHCCRILILDLPLAALFALYVSSTLLHKITVEYYIPQINLMKWNVRRQNEGLTYYDRLCRDEDVTTSNPVDLLIHSDMDSEACMEHMLTHGVSIYQNLISDETATAARNYILKRNKLEVNINVISNKNRWSFGVDVNADPSIRQALKEITSNKQLTEALHKIAGRNAAVIEFTGITAAYGAADQYLHKDVVPKGSAFKYGRNFVPSYSLFIPLQDVTAAMGCTEVCPGTHMCASDDYNPCSSKSMFVSGKSGSWKRGNGALVNQQLYHRGTAHKDPNGPERVLFILTFASRPRFAKNQLETRIIGFEGSYSLKWDQWGHTLSDFANPEQHMIEPWRKLRAFGLYKKPGREWGWDYITVASMRIANKDTSYTPDDLETFAEEGGYSFIPAFLKAELQEEDTWTDYLLNQIVKVMKWLQKVNFLVLAGYLGLLAVISALMWLFKVKSNGNIVTRALCRLVVTHGLIVLIALWIAHRVHTSQWGENIRLQKAFRGYRKPALSRQNSTLPNELDVLIDQRLQSSYLASYNRLIDVHHPGNAEYHRIVNLNSVNYFNLPIPAQHVLTKSIIKEIHSSKQGRLLKQTREPLWAVLSENEALAQVHLDLMKASHPTLAFILTQLHYFWNELSAGVFRETALHKAHIPALLDALRKKLIGFIPPLPTKGTCRPGAQRVTASPIRASLSVISPKQSSSQRSARRIIPSPKPPLPDPVAPWPSAWVQEGDIVDILYPDTTNEYYSGVIVHMNANKGRISVLYDDGDKDAAICRHCARPRRPYAIDQLVGVRKDSVYYEGRIVAMYNNGTFDILTARIGMQRNVTTADMRRFFREFEVGALILAKFQGVGNNWYQGTITRVNKDGTFDVEYADGDKEYSVEPEHIKF